MPSTKKGNRTLANNYRPVSLTSIVCKVLEKVIRTSIMEYLSENKLLTDCQYGFVPGRSISLQLLHLLDMWIEALEDNASIDCVYLDFCKAFDKVPHLRLLGKMQAYKFHPDLIAWMHNF